MRFLVIGCGSIGQKHIGNLKKLGQSVAGCDVNKFRAGNVSRRHKIKVFSGLKEAFCEKFDAAIICTPTSLHIPVAIEAAKRSMHILIEKPISHNMRGIDELESIATKKRLVILVACNARFLPGLLHVKDMIKRGKIGKVLSVKAHCGYFLPYWHPKSDYRKEYSAQKRLGGGVIFDDIHEIDSLISFFGKVDEVFCFADRISTLKIDTEDIAEIFLKFKKGVVAQIHLDYLQKAYRRYYEFIGDNGTIVMDVISQSVKWYSPKSKKWREKIFHRELTTRNEAMFINELKHFINCIRGKEKSVNDVRSARECLRVALASHESARKKELVKL